jgi:hypothetical protein
MKKNLGEMYCEDERWVGYCSTLDRLTIVMLGVCIRYNNQ